MAICQCRSEIRNWVLLVGLGVGPLSRGQPKIGNYDLGRGLLVPENLQYWDRGAGKGNIAHRAPCSLAACRARYTLYNDHLCKVHIAHFEQCTLHYQAHCTLHCAPGTHTVQCTLCRVLTLHTVLHLEHSAHWTPCTVHLHLAPDAHEAPHGAHRTSYILGILHTAALRTHTTRQAQRVVNACVRCTFHAAHCTPWHVACPAHCTPCTLLTTYGTLDTLYSV